MWGESEEGVTVLRRGGGGTTPRVRAAKSSEFGEGKLNEEIKKGKRREGEKKKRKQTTDYEEAVCWPSAAVQGTA